MIIGIGGVSRAGKSTLAARLADFFKRNGQTTDIFCQDEYVKPKISIPKVQGVPDWERPSTIKWDKLTKDIEKSTADIKVVEGLFSFYPASLRKMYDLKVFLEISKETFQQRKNTDQRWEEEPDWYAEHVWRSYLKYGQTKGDKGEYMILSGESEVDLLKIVSGTTSD
ncbi:uridine kinase family protein [Marinoscillum furvescens]|uniref:Uridine kinase n=1 Tax=Marinoscillum furvescens DSM 4134 TaxID=1122208 RepID=A0A3D9L4L6_MARFU|nr:hypothetical protein [Marinoscillum furvescens]REE00553.1 uridine kinase [Marinoscillum furvescens DSM 4134]